jgi:coproporphyrinogen III oxidase-like Fe-S oxidoreductase
MVSVRRLDGFEEAAFERTFGSALQDVSPALPRLVAGGLLVRADGRVALTREGLLLADSVTAKLAELLTG